MSSCLDLPTLSLAAYVSVTLFRLDFLRQQLLRQSISGIWFLLVRLLFLHVSSFLELELNEVKKELFLLRLHLKCLVYSRLSTQRLRGHFKAELRF